VARAVNCDALDGEPATKLLTDLTNGDVVAMCEAHWADMIMALAEGLGMGRPELDDAGGPPDAPGDSMGPVRLDDDAAIDAQGRELAPELGGLTRDGVVPYAGPDADDPGNLNAHAAKAAKRRQSEPSHRARVRRELADRADSPKTSADAIPDPGESRR
jgi:hypothetical protein